MNDSRRIELAHRGIDPRSAELPVTTRAGYEALVAKLYAPYHLSIKDQRRLAEISRFVWLLEAMDDTLQHELTALRRSVASEYEETEDQ